MANSRFHLILFNIFGLDGNITNVIKIKMKPLARTWNIISKSRENIVRTRVGCCQNKKVNKTNKKIRVPGVISCRYLRFLLGILFAEKYLKKRQSLHKKWRFPLRRVTNGVDLGYCKSSAIIWLFTKSKVD